MTSAGIKYGSLFEVGKNRNDRPIFNYRLDWDVKLGTPAKNIIESAKKIQASAEAKKMHPAQSYIPTRARGRPDRYLDIVEKRKDGACLYIFCLNAQYGGKDRLLFIENVARYITLPLNSSTDEDFLKKPEDYDETDLRYGSFTCNPYDVRKSFLADRIKKTAYPHIKRLNIPFYLNVRDPILGAAPWVLSDHSRSDDLDSDHSHSDHPHPHRTRGAPFTHGGVHPIPVAVLSVDIT